MSQTALLYQLRNGDWIDLSTVTGIFPNAGRDALYNVAPYVVVKMGVNSRVLHFGTYGAAQTYAADLASMVNAVLGART